MPRFSDMLCRQHLQCGKIEILNKVSRHKRTQKTLHHLFFGEEALVDGIAPDAELLAGFIAVCFFLHGDTIGASPEHSKSEGVSSAQPVQPSTPASAPVAKRKETPPRNLPLLLPAGPPLPAQRSRSRPTGPVAPPDTDPCASHRLHPSLHRDGRASGHQRALDRPLEQEAFHRAVLPEGQPALAVRRLAAGDSVPAEAGSAAATGQDACVLPAKSNSKPAGSGTAPPFTLTADAASGHSLRSAPAGKRRQGQGSSAA